jgi:O-antigen/teichoic acid export membrane protein
VDTDPSRSALEEGSAGGRAVRGSALRVGSYFAQLGLSLASVPLMVRHLGPDDYGRYVTVSSIVFIIAGFTEAGLMYLGVRHYVALAGAERERYMRSLAGLRLVLTVLGVLAAVAFTWVTGAEPVLVAGTAIVGVGTLMLLVQATYTIPLQADLRFGTLSVIDLLKQLVLTAFIVAFVIVGTGLVTFFWANVASGLAVLAATLWCVRGELSTLVPAFDVGVWRRVAHEVLPYGLAAAVGLVYFRLAVVIMSYIATPFETGIYSTAFRIVEVLTSLPWLAVATGFPILVQARGDTRRLRFALQRMFEVATIAGVGLALAVALGAPFAVAVIAGPGFEAAVPVLRLLGLALVTCFLAATWSFALLSLERYRDLLIANVVGVIVVAAGTFALEPSLGARGAAIATVLGEAVLATLYIVIVARADRELMARFRFVWKILLAAGAAALAALLPFPAVVEAAIGTAAYVAVLLLVGGVPRELVQALLRRAS